MRIGVQWLAHLCGTYLAQPVLFPFTLVSFPQAIFSFQSSTPTLPTSIFSFQKDGVMGGVVDHHKVNVMPLLTPEQAASELAISTRQLRDLTVSGEIRYINIGNGSVRETRRYDPADIEDFKSRRRSVGGKTVRATSRTKSDFIDTTDFQRRLEELRSKRAKRKT